MEPLKPEEKERILRKSQAAPEELDDYERLLAERYTSDPDLPLAPPEAEAEAPGDKALGEMSGRAEAAFRGVRVRRMLEQGQREERIAELHQRLFVDRPRRPGGGSNRTR